MNHSGDAAEQIVRLSLEGTEVALKLTGTAAKELAFMLVSALRGKGSTLKPKGKARLTAMLKSGKPLEIFSVADGDLKNFAKGAKQYGIVYCVLRNKKNGPDGLCDIMVLAEDAPKISRVVERFKFATIDKAQIEHDIAAERAEREAAPGDETEAPDADDTDKLLDDFLGTDEGKAELDVPEPVEAPDHEGAGDPDFFTETAQGRPSEIFSARDENPAEATAPKPSVREELREIKAARKQAEAEPAPAQEDRKTAERPKRLSETRHKQPPKGGKRLKSKKAKERT